MDLQLDGWVANDADGSVHCVAEGPRSDLERLLAAIEVGPPAALVDRVNTMWGPAIGGLGPFGIRSGVHSGD
jgi:acylphosphatase